MTNDEDSGAGLRRGIYLLLILIGLGIVLGRIMAVDAIDLTRVHADQVKKQLKVRKDALQKEGLKGEELDAAIEKEKARIELTARPHRRPFLSGNDRSRWCTVRALVEPEMRVDGAPYAIEKVIQQDGWDTIDMVKHDGQGHPVALDDAAGGHLYSSKPPLLPTLMAGEYWLIYKLTGMTLGGEPFAVGRFMLVTINGGLLLVYFLALAGIIERLGKTDWGRIFVMASAVFGTYLTTFAIVINNHLVAAACAAVLLYAAVRIWFENDRRAWLFAVAGLFAALMAANELPAASLAALVSLALLWRAPRQTLMAYVPAALVVVAAFFATNWIAHRSVMPAYGHRKAGDNWYDYKYVRNGRVIEGYWRNPQGVDRGEPSVPRYALHALVGHHGVFLLTPVWLLSVAGAGMWLARGPDRRLRELAAAVALITLVCLTFYIGLRPQIERNYGGTASAFRWVFWLAPLWLATMLPCADVMAGRRWLRGIALAMLTASVASACYPIWNPWTHPWAVDFLGWLTPG